MIETKGLVKTYSGRKVVNDVSIHVNRGEIVGLLGPNGAGKTTTFYQVVGLVKPQAGDIFLDHQNITHLPMHRRARLGIGYLPQEPSIFKKLTVEENLLVLWELLNIVPKSEYSSRVEGLLAELHISHLRKSKGYQLSGGEKRRVEIVRALALNPSFILLDEPFAGIDPIAVNDIQTIIKQLREKGLGILITDHNVRETLAIVDRAYIIHSGQILLSGTSEEIVNDPQARQFYLGESFTL